MLNGSLLDAAGELAPPKMFVEGVDFAGVLLKKRFGDCFALSGIVAAAGLGLGGGARLAKGFEGAAAAAVGG